MTERPSTAVEDDRGEYRSLTRNEADMAFRRRAWTIFEWLGDPRGQTLLDCGCGRGFYLKMIHRLAAAGDGEEKAGLTRIHGVELEMAHLARGRRQVAGLVGVLANRASVYALPYSDSSFDTVILSEVLEHLGDEAAALAEIRRVLKPGGQLLVTVPHARYPFWWDPINRTLEAVLGTHVRRGPLAGIWAFHVRLYTPERLRSVLTGAGFATVEERSFTHHCLPFTHNLLYGLGKPLLERGWLGRRLTAAADRGGFDLPPAGWLNPVRWLIAMLEWVDRRNRMNEAPGRSTVNLCLRARKPASGVSSEGTAAR